VADCIDITLVANAGVMIEGNGVGLLVDGMHHEDGHPFSKVLESDMERMRQGAEPFAKLDYLLFTHEHPDHFTPDRVLEHVRHRPVRGVFLPGARGGSPSLALLHKYMREQGIPHQSLGLGPGQARQYSPEDGLRITAIGARHMGAQFQAVRNDCFLLSLGSMNLLFTGDADHVGGYYESALKHTALDAVFVNPIFYHNPDGQAIINEIFRPQHVVIYHMPSLREDPFHLALTVKRALKKYARPEIRTHVLDSEHTHLCLYPPTK